MLEKLQELFKAIGLPVGLVAVIVAVAGFVGLPLEQALQLFGVLVGVPFVISYSNKPACFALSPFWRSSKMGRAGVGSSSPANNPVGTLPAMISRLTNSSSTSFS